MDVSATSQMNPSVTQLATNYQFQKLISSPIQNSTYLSSSFYKTFELLFQENTYPHSLIYPLSYFTPTLLIIQTMKPLSQAPTIILSLLSLTTLSTSISTSTPHQPLFLLTNISFSASYIYSTPAHLAASSGHISFSLNNTAIDTYSPSPYQYGSGSGPQTTSCAATCDDYPGVYCAGWEVWKCDSGNANTDANTTFSFEDAGLFNVTQIWAKS